jgi:hypothetical protein
MLAFLAGLPIPWMMGSSHLAGQGMWERMNTDLRRREQETDKATPDQISQYYISIGNYNSIIFHRDRER